MSPKNIFLIAAVDSKYGIGKDNDLPWKGQFKDDLRYFHATTTETADKNKQNAVIMGRKTWESLPAFIRPLKKRLNVILSQNTDFQADGAEVFYSLDEAIENIEKTRNDIETIYVIGGGKVYSEAILRPDITGIYLTHIDKSFDCDAHFPAIPEDFHQCKKLGEVEEAGVSYEYRLYQKSST